MFYRAIIPIVVELRGQGLSLRAIAAELHRRGIRMRHCGTGWSASQVRRMLARAAKMQAEQQRLAPVPPVPAVPPSATAAPMIHLLVGGKQFGPFRAAFLQERTAVVDPATLARSGPTDEWRPLRELLKFSSVEC